MAYPTVDVITTNLDASTDSPASARADLLDLAQKFNLLRPLPADLAASSGATLVGYLPAGTGAVARSVQSRLRDTISVKDFGAVGDGITNDTAAFQACNDAATVNVGRSVYVPPGRYIVNNLNISNPGIWYGDKNASTIVTNIAGADCFILNAQQVFIEDLIFGTTVTKTGGAFIKSNSGPNQISNVLMIGAYTGIEINESMNKVYNCQINDLVGVYGVGVRITKGAAVYVDGLITGSVAVPLAGIYIGGSTVQDVTITNCNLMATGVSLYINSATGTVIPSVFAANCFFDGSVSGLRLRAETGSSIVRCTFTQCWFSSHTTHGADIQLVGTGVVDGVDFIGCHFFLNSAGYGVTIGAGAKNVKLIGCSIAENSIGIGVQGDTTNTTLIGNRIGDTHGLGVNGTGVLQLGTAPVNFVMSDNNMAGNTLILNDQAPTLTKLARNIGIVSTASGQVTLNPGTSVTVTHNLSKTPLISQISAIPISAVGTTGGYWLSNVTATTFQINISTAGAVIFAWFANTEL